MGIAAVRRGAEFIGIEQHDDYVQVAKARIAAVEVGAGPLFT
jgi:DNA modification methylase